MLRIVSASAEGKFRSDYTLKELPRLLDSEGARTWIDIYHATDIENEVLATMFGFHPLSVEDCVEDVHHPKLDDYGDYLYLIMHAPYRDGTELASAELDAFLAANFLLTYRKGATDCVNDIFSRPERAEDVLTRGLDYTLYVILDSLVGQYFPILDALENEIDKLESEIFEEPDPSMLQRMLSLKRALLQMRRIAGPQREIVSNLSRGHGRFIDREAALHFRDVYDAFYRVIDTIDVYKDLVSGTMETYLTVASHRLNEVMKFLTILSTLMMPPTLIAGIYGMNFENMPELKWEHGYAFSLGLIAFTMLILLAVFRRRKWL